MEEVRPLPAALLPGALVGPAPLAMPPIDPDAATTRALLRGAVDEAVTLLRADGGLVYLLDASKQTLRMLEDTGVTDDGVRAWARGLEIPVGSGMFGKAVGERRVVVTGDYAHDERFRHMPETDRVATQASMVSMVVAPLEAKYAVLGAIAVFSSRPDAYDDQDVALVRTLAAHAAATLANEALIDALGETAKQLARRSERERTLRELVGSLADVREPVELLRSVLLAVAKVSGARGALIDRVDSSGRRTHTVLTRTAEGTIEHAVREPGHGDWGVMGRAMEERRLVSTGDYLNDNRFVHTQASDEMARKVGIVSVVAAPLMVDGEIQGVLAAHSDKVDAFDDEAVEMMNVLADHAAVAIANALRMEELDDSRNDLARRASEERALREIAASLATLTDPDEVLAQTVEAACRLVGGEWAEIARLEPDGVMAWSHVHGRNAPEILDFQAQNRQTVGLGIMGRAAELRRTLITGDYLGDDSFVHAPANDEFARDAGFRSIIAAPLIGEDGILGILAVHSAKPDAFTEAQIPLIDAFANIATVAMVNARLIEALDRSRTDLARRASEERELREIGAKLASLRNPDDVLEQAVDAVCRLVGGEWAEIARLEPDLRMTWTHVYGLNDPELQAFQANLQLSLGEGILGKAAEQRRTVYTRDYLVDDSFMHLEKSDEFARLAGFRSLIAAPLIAGEDGVIGILAVHSRVPNAFDETHVSLVDAFANIAAVAMGNARLIEALDQSESRYRDLLAASPDIVFTVDERGAFTYISDTLERQLGWRRAEVEGQHFSTIIDTGSMDSARERWRQLQETPGVVLNARFDLIHRDGRRLPYEIRSSGLAVDDEFVGVMGVARDISDRDRLERELRASELELRESEAKYRYLVDNSPDIVWSADAAGILTYMSETCEEVLGWRPDEVVGQHFARVVHPSSLGYVTERYRESLEGAPERELRYRFNGNHKDGSKIPLEMHARTILVDGVYVGTHGACRDLRERDRLERDLRRHAAELAASEERAHLARELHDSVTQALFSMTLVTKSIDMLLDSDPAKARERLGTLAELQADALAEMRALIFELRPASLETAGLVGALRTHCAALQGRTGVAVVLEAEDEGRLPGEIEAALFRVAQEALNNVVKHAAAHQVRVAVSHNAARAVLEVEDDGAGFDPGSVPDGHLGLAGMRARAEKLGGRLAVTSARGQGTVIRVEVPLPREAGERFAAVPAGGAAGASRDVAGSPRV